MEKRLSCRAMGLNCDFVVREESENGIVREISEHLKNVHRIEWTKELEVRARDLIRLVEA